ncbi:MAG TPA: hypothetical protein VN578_18475 [Candidatus Binatia bacterium]|nr:hypothetical protein [Candidatus Binatia bacterium]
MSPLPADAQFALPETTATHSHSGQFVVRATRSSVPGTGPLGLETNRSFIRLDPSLVPVSCERIKQNLARELNAAASWQGTIFVVLYPAVSPEDPITLTSERFRDGWQYRVELPDMIERTRYVRALVQVLLVEMANRSGAAHSAEIPTWLVEGLTEKLLAFSEKEILLAPARTAGNGFNVPFTPVSVPRKDNPLEQIHRVLSRQPPLSFDQLSWPGDDELTGAAGELYRSSAHLFVTELLRLENGPACLRFMLAELPQRFNWQFAFLRAFHAWFQRPLDVEKWWALQVAHFTGRELAQTWPAEESWQKFDQIIHSPVQVRATTNELPLRAEVTLQSIIREWDHDRQTVALQSKLHEMDLLRLRLAQEFVPLFDEYRQSLVEYLQNRDKAGLLSRKTTARRRAVDEALSQLAALDARREALRPIEKRRPAAVQAQVNPPAAP